MKRWICLLSLLGLLGGCSAVLPSDQETSEEDTIHYQVEIQENVQEFPGADGSIVLRSTLELPVLMVYHGDRRIEQAASQEEQGALEAAESFNRCFEDWQTEGEMIQLSEMAKELEDEQKWRQEMGLNQAYEVGLDCEVYQTEQMISVKGTYVSYLGGAHPNTGFLSWNFDLTSGNFFSPLLLAEDGKSFSEAVQAEILRQAAQPREDGTVPIETYWQEYPLIVKDWIHYAVSFHPTGMEVTFSPYELSSYAAGPQTFRFSYEWLNPYLGPHGILLLEP